MHGLNESNILSKTGLSLNNIPTDVLQNIQNQNSSASNINRMSNINQNNVGQNIPYNNDNYINNNDYNRYNINQQNPFIQNNDYYNMQNNQNKYINNNINNCQQGFRFLRGTDNIFLTELVKEECKSAINQGIYTDLGGLQNIIRNKLYQSTNDNWFVTIMNDNNFNIPENFVNNSLSIFQYSDSLNNFYIIIYK